MSAAVSLSPVPHVVVPRRPTTARCPACNPLHTPGLTRRPAAKHTAAREACGVCKGTQTVSVEVSMRYVGKMNEEPTSEANFSAIPGRTRTARGAA